MCFRDRGRPEEAITACRAALTLDPKSVGAHYNLGRAYARLRQTKQAIAEYETALRLNPKFPGAWLALGALHANLTKRPADAVRCFDRYLQLVPKPPDCVCWIKAYADKHR